MVAAHIVRGSFQRCDDCRVCIFFRFGKLLFRYLKIFGGKICAIDELRVLDNGFIAMTAHVLDDAHGDFRRREIGAEDLSVRLANLWIELHLIEGRLHQELPYFIFTELFRRYNLHDFASPLSNALRKSSTKR